MGLNGDGSATLYDLVNIYSKKITEVPVSRASQLTPIQSHNTSVGVEYSTSNGLSQEKFSTARDTEYFDAIEKYGEDSKEVEELVRKAAEEGGYYKQLYHGTPNGVFFVFKNWQYFTENKEYADRYQHPGASSNGYKKTALNPKTYTVALYYNSKVFDTRTKEAKKVFYDEFYRKYGNGTDLSEKGLPDWTDGDDLVEFIEDNEYDYDVILVDEGGTGGYGEEVKDRGIAYIVKNSAQIKSLDPVTRDDEGNIIPLSERFNSEKSDIRYSTPRDSENLIDRYTEKEYNARGWVAVNKVITVAESKSLYSQFADFKKNGFKYPVTKSGEACIIVNDDKSESTHLVLIKGTIKSPTISSVISVNAENYALKICLLEDVRYEGRVFENISYIERMGREKLFAVITCKDYGTFSKISRSGQQLRKSNSYSTARSSAGQYGTGNSEQDTTTEITDKSSSNGGGFSNAQNSFSTSRDYETNPIYALDMSQAKDMLQRAFNAANFLEYYDGKFKNGDEWLKSEGLRNIALEIEANQALYKKFIEGHPGWVEGKFTTEDVLQAYLDGTLVGKSKENAARIDRSQSDNKADSRFYAPKTIEDAKAQFETAKQKITNSNREAVTKARADILFFAHEKGAAAALGVSDTELNKLLRQWSRYSSRAREASIKINEGAAVTNRWTGIENLSILNRQNITADNIKSMVKSVEGNPSDYEVGYISRAMLSLDTHIDWSWLNFKFDTYQGVNQSRGMGSRCLGYYDDRQSLIHVTGDGNVVSHEMGHALDNQWGREVTGGKRRLELTELRINDDAIVSDEARQWIKNFKLFIQDITDSSDISSQYYQSANETFARFVSKFVAWNEMLSTGNEYYFRDKSYVNDKFTTKQFVEFARLLQEKSALNLSLETNNNNISLSDKKEAFLEEAKQFRTDIIPLSERFNSEKEDIRWSTGREDIIDLSDDNELAKLISDKHGAPKYKIINEYIYDILGGQTVTMSDGKKAIVDKRDALHIAHKAGNKKTAEISQIKQLVEYARLVAYEEEDKSRKKFTDSYYYKANVKYKDEKYPVYINLGKAKDGTYHIYDLTQKLRDSAHRINDVERPVGNALETELLEIMYHLFSALSSQLCILSKKTASLNLFPPSKPPKSTGKTRLNPVRQALMGMLTYATTVFPQTARLRDR
ncbi:MAG: hypothetical protein K6B52_03955 [Clostridiales bacterium]|nr:hypothetical protein [Clostridiales bacterium]